ncbi:MAG TPA: Uma2 family endonuclease [Bacteroidetes bacterium]|nr:Uma2 family endonuclease [Bacteroidota bacterium]
MTTAPIEIKEKTYTVKEWLELEKHSDIRHEYYYGKLIPMAGEAKRANILAGNIKKHLDDPLYEKGFLIYDHDVKAEVVPEGIYRYPDLVAAPIDDDEDEYIVKQPVMMAKVASEKSGFRDRVKKRKEYLNIKTMKYYLIVSQNEMWVVLHSRGSTGNWETQYLTEPEDVAELTDFGICISLADIYKRVALKSGN